VGDLPHRKSGREGLAGRDLSPGQTRNHTGVTAGGNILPPGSIERSVDKARCLVDQRPEE